MHSDIKEIINKLKIVFLHIGVDFLPVTRKTLNFIGKICELMKQLSEGKIVIIAVDNQQLKSRLRDHLNQ